jgi:hypothetical protein
VFASARDGMGARNGDAARRAGSGLGAAAGEVPDAAVVADDGDADDGDADDGADDDATAGGGAGVVEPRVGCADAARTNPSASAAGATMRVRADVTRRPYTVRT